MQCKDSLPRVHLEPGLYLTGLGGICPLQHFPRLCLNDFDWQLTHLAALIYELHE